MFSILILVQKYAYVSLFNKSLFFTCFDSSMFLNSIAQVTGVLETLHDLNYSSTNYRGHIKNARYFMKNESQLNLIRRSIIFCHNVHLI
jgi:hypothetical protein